jgi:N-acetylglucosaminyldiphosphoundecaprenol N-acetyl-beta-D-mannosaminyltransferase
LNLREAQDLRTQVESTAPDILWVGLSTPKQERFMAEYMSKLNVTLMVGVGAAFDFHSGSVKQAPRWLQRAGFEWLYRLSHEPRRLWRRNLKNFGFIPLVAGQWSGLRTYELPLAPVPHRESSENDRGETGSDEENSLD